MDGRRDPSELVGAGVELRIDQCGRKMFVQSLFRGRQPFDPSRQRCPGAPSTSGDTSMASELSPVNRAH